ncbi:MAG: YraN family protein [Patescibacteria group bacterium]
MFRAKTLKSETGKLGEDLACEYLVGRGYRILKRNYRKPWGEIDIIARPVTNILVFVEVKALKENSAGGLLPEDHLTSSKLKKLQRTCREFVAENPDLVNEDRGWQIDLVAIKIPVCPRGQAGAENPALKNCDIRHYENI